MSNENHSYSVSRIAIKGILEKKEVLRGQLIRHLAPLTISQLLRVFPIHGEFIIMWMFSVTSKHN
jgi:hypothetical protein